MDKCKKESETKEKVGKKRKKNRKLVLKALTDPEFRKALEEDAAAVLGVKQLSQINEKEIQCILMMVEGINGQIAATGDLLLCLNNGPEPCPVQEPTVPT